MKGFTLIELMIAVAIISILATVGYPSYMSHVTDTRRDKAEACLVELSQNMERYYTMNMTYEDAGLALAQCRTELGEFYEFGFSSTPDANSYTLLATAKGSQASRDGECSTLSLNQNSVKTPAACW
ncbi:MAG: type IV pilin protein [Ketobacteraceae bacterium]|nr:type IV pilin protein [Ketobacteraceae bacterium]